MHPVLPPRFRSPSVFGSPPLAAWLCVAALALLGSLGCSSPLSNAAVAGQSARVAQLLEAGASPDETDRRGRSALELAIIKGHPETVETLLEAGANPDRIGPYGWAPIHWAAIRGEQEITEHLVEADADLDQLSKRTSAPAIVEAVLNDHAEVLQVLIDGGADLDLPQRRRHGGTALHAAIRTKRTDLARRLLVAGARTDVRDRDKRTPRDLAERMRQSDVLAMMDAGGAGLAARASRPSPTRPAGALDDRLMSALRRSDLDALDVLLRERIDVRSWSLQGRNALEWAIRYEDVRIFERLVQAGMPIDRPGDQGLTPLHWAAREGASGIARFLVHSGAPLDARNPANGATPLIEATWMNELDVARLLIAAGADPDLLERDRSEGSALHIAVRAPRPELVAPLLAAGASPTLPDGRGRTALDEARRLRRDDWVALMRQGPPTPRLAEGSGLAPLAPRGDSPSLVGVDFGRYHALVVGNDEYASLPDLETATTDARAVARLLESKYDFEVTLLLNATRSQLLATLAEIRRRLGPRDNLLLYYAGHGWFDERTDRGYWFPVDADERSPANWVSNVDVTDTLKSMDAKHIMIVADSCYSGTLTRGLKIPDRRRDYLRRMATKRARVVMSSGGLEPVIDSGGEGHSVFASAFLRALEENRGVIDGTELFGRIRRPVMLGADQTPQYGDIRRAGHDGGDFLFVRTR